jgi:hypothetical protein
MCDGVNYRAGDSGSLILREEGRGEENRDWIGESGGTLNV